MTLTIHLATKSSQPTPAPPSPSLNAVTTAVEFIPKETGAEAALGCHADVPPEAEVPKDDPRLEQVLRLAKRGFTLFPITPRNKVPLKGFKWKELATNDEQRLRDWFAQYPECNWAARTGPEFNVFVLDVDGDVGRTSLNSLLLQESALPPTLITHTGKLLGCHFWFEHPSNGIPLQNSAGKLGAGLDIRGEGGYVVIPPSVHPNGTTYSFDDEGAEIRSAPEWLLGLIAHDFGAEGLHQSETDPQGRVIPVGERNDTLFRDACAMRRRGATEEEIKAFLRLANLRCEEALPEPQLVKIAHSASGYLPAPPAEDHAQTLKLDPAAMQGVAGKVVKAIIPHTEADEAALLMHFLAAYGSLIGRHAHCSVDGAKHYTNIFFACVGATAKGRKGTSWNRVRGILELVDPEWAKDRIQSGLSSGEGLIAAAGCGGVTTSDTGTPIADTRLFIVESELASVLKRMAREGNTLSATIRNAWDTGSFQIMVKKNPMKVDDAHISIVAHITLEDLRRYLTATDSANGFANRFLWAQSVRSKCLPEGGSLTDEEKGHLANLVKPAVAFGRKAGVLERDDEAKELWAMIYPELSEGHSGLFGAVTSRAEAQVLRLSMLYALLDCSPTIRRPHLEAAVAVWEYCEETARWMFGSRRGDSIADEILRVLLTRSEGMTRNEIMDHFNRHKSGTELRQALARLQDEGCVRIERRKTAGRQAQIWIANDLKKRGRRAEDTEEQSEEVRPLDDDGN